MMPLSVSSTPIASASPSRWRPTPLSRSVGPPTSSTRPLPPTISQRGPAYLDEKKQQTITTPATVRLKRDDVERLMEGRPAGSTLEEALEVFEVFASGTLADEIYVLDDVAGKRIAIAPAALKAKYRKE